MTSTYCCSTFKSQGISAARRDAGRQQPCIGCHSTYQNVEKGIDISSSVGAEIIAMPEMMRNLQKETWNVARQSRSRRRRDKLNETRLLSFEQSLERWAWFLEKTCGSDGVVGKKSHPVLTLEPSHNPHLGVSGLLEDLSASVYLLPRDS